MLDGVVPPLIVLGAGSVLALLRHYIARRQGQSDRLVDLAVVVTVIALTMTLELEMGRTPTYRNGPVRFWSGDINSDQNSQQIADPYTFTHIIHGAAFYGLIGLAAPSLTFGGVAIVVVTLEAAWEAYENANQVINRYRAETVSLGYYGDSLINSCSDIVACLLGLVLAWRRPAWVTWSWVVVVEVVLAIWIRDNLTLNIIMLVHPIHAIKNWQLGLAGV